MCKNEAERKNEKIQICSLQWISLEFFFFIYLYHPPSCWRSSFAACLCFCSCFFHSFSLIYCRMCWTLASWKIVIIGRKKKKEKNETKAFQDVTRVMMTWWHKQNKTAATAIAKKKWIKFIHEHNLRSHAILNRSSHQLSNAF